MTNHLFIIKLRYIAPIDQVDKYLIEHRAYLDTCYANGNYLASGPQVPRTGGIILAQGASKIQIDELMQKDPFMIHGIAEYDVIEFDAIKAIDGVKDWLRS